MILNRLFLFKIAVILLVRMWVEMPAKMPLSSTMMSSSLWGCELKYLRLVKVLRTIRHPPCEDVSWNVYNPESRFQESLSSSLWGCELKFCISNDNHDLFCHPPCEDVSWNNKNKDKYYKVMVILLVRMWVEISCKKK